MPGPRPASSRAPPTSFLAIGLAYDQNQEELAREMTNNTFAVHGGRAYPNAGKALGPGAWGLYSGFRRECDERLGDDAESVLIKQRAGVNGGVQPRNLFAVHDGMTVQLQLCRDPVTRQRLIDAGMYPDQWAKELAPMIEKFGTALGNGTTQETTIGSGESALQWALVKMEILLSRGKAFLRAWVSPTAAEALEKAIPWRREGGGKQTATDQASGPQAGDAGDGRDAEYGDDGTGHGGRASGAGCDGHAAGAGCGGGASGGRCGARAPSRVHRRGSAPAVTRRLLYVGCRCAACGLIGV